MKLFNTLTNKKEEFKPLKEGEVSIYVCGPTVYNYVHIGNTRPMIVFDVLRRTFEYLGDKVTFVSNFTDVDDKIIKAAKQEGITEKELTDKYIKAYEDVRRGLNLEFPTYAPRVTETMDQIISFIQKLVDKGYAYVVDGDVYFRVSKVKEYGELSGIKIEDLEAGASERVEDKGVKEETTEKRQKDMPSRLNARRKIMTKLNKVEGEDVMAKLFNEIAPKYEGRVGGYTRIVKAGPRRGDAAEVAILQLV